MWFVIPLIVGNAVAFRYFRRAARNLSPLGERRYVLVWWLGVWAGRKYFTEEGLRQRNRALAWVFVTFIVTFAVIVVTGVGDT